MNRNSEAITIFCSRLCAAEGVKPLEPREWSELAGKMLEQNLQPESLPDFEQKDFTEQPGVAEEAVEMPVLQEEKPKPKKAQQISLFD